MPHQFLIFSQSGYLIRIVAINSHSLCQTVQIQISWLLQKPTDLDLHCLRRQGISGSSKTRVNVSACANKIQSRREVESYRDCVLDYLICDDNSRCNPCLFVLRFYGPVNPMGSCRARSVYLTTRLLGRLSPLSG